LLISRRASLSCLRKGVAINSPDIADQAARSANIKTNGDERAWRYRFRLPPPFDGKSLRFPLAMPLTRHCLSRCGMDSEVIDLKISHCFGQALPYVSILENKLIIATRAG
jgi:hypothetical protein